MKNRRVISLFFAIVPCLAVLVALMVLGNSARAQATTRYVATTGVDSGDCTDANDPCRTVQYAVDVANQDDTVKIATGVYNEIKYHRGHSQIVYIDKTIAIRGGYTTPGFTDPPDPETNPTTLNAEGQGRVLYISGGFSQSISPTVEGLHITGGDAAGESGGGVYVFFAAANIRYNQVFSNTAYYGGGGLSLWRSGATLSGNTVTDNNAIHGTGGGLLLLHSDVTLSGNTVSGNTAYYEGGGLALEGGNVTITGNTISGNTANGVGGGLFLHDSDVTITGNTMSGNTAYRGGGLSAIKGPVTLNGNIVQGNTASTAYGGRGGGLFLIECHATLSDNTISGNTAGRGGGLYLEDSDARLTNNIVADNQANWHGSGLHIDGGSSLRLAHTTIARNFGGERGGGVYVVELHPSALAMTNTILLSHTVGIYVSSGCTATLEGTLWGTGTWANESDWGGYGTIITGTINHWGDPVFQDPGAGDYHIGPGSAALDRGVDTGVHQDIDSQPRPYQTPDLGADEYWPPGVLNYVNLPLITRNAP